MCVGVYGASQAGKSYLVSVLARRGNDRLMTRLGTQEIDFIQDINPEGGKESTGLVTRFTTDHFETPPGFPIAVKLLSEFDLAKLFVNSFANDILPVEDDQMETHQERIELVLGQLESAPRIPNHITVEDVYDLEDYCNSRFISTMRIQALKRVDFWSRAAALIPNLGDRDRVQLLQLLWEELPVYTQMFEVLTSELNRIGHPKQIYCAPESLFNVEKNRWQRSNQSIINVSTLSNIGQPNDTRIPISTLSGKKSDLALSNLCGLIAELVISIKDQPHEFFSYTDLLDFPGARSRKRLDRKDKALAQPEARVENFLRGKVAYLFDKYSADLELSAMLLCVGDGPQEVAGLETLIDDWIEMTHGNQAVDRDQLATALFLVLTKFDKEFIQGAGKSTDGTRWETRLTASLINPFASHARKTNWVNRWDSKGAFRNTFWLRNPNADQLGLIEYEGEPGASKELGFSKARQDLITQLKQAFLDNELVKKHFQHPERAWNAGMSLNDGGVTYLIQCLSDICKPDVKIKQVDSRINTLLRDREMDLRKYYVSGNLEDLIVEKRALARDFLITGAELFKKQRLGEFISFILLSDHNARDIFDRTQLICEREKSAKRAPNTISTPSIEKIDKDLAEALGIASDVAIKENDIKPESSSQGADDFPNRFIASMIEDWHTTVLQRAGSSQASDYLHLNRDLLVKLLNELEFAAMRTGLIDELKDRVRSNYQFKPDDRKSWIWRQTAGVTAQFNEFLVRGGSLASSESQNSNIESFDGKPLVIFEPTEDVIDDVDLPDNNINFSRQYFLDWMNAVQFTIRNNASYLAGSTGDVESNRALGDIIEKLSALFRLEHAHS